MAKKSNLKKAKRLDTENAGRFIRVYDFPSHREPKKTGKKCRVCKGDIVEELGYAQPDKFPLIGENARPRLEVRGYHCDHCGIKYAFLPK